MVEVVASYRYREKKAIRLERAWTFPVVPTLQRRLGQGRIAGTNGCLRALRRLRRDMDHPRTPQDGPAE